MSVDKTIFNDLNKWENFIRKNINDVIESKVPEHPPNRENLNKWIDKHRLGEYEYDEKDNNDVELSSIIANSITYVSFTDMLTRLNQMVNELFTIQEFHRYNLYLFIPPKVKKSNFMFTVIFYFFCMLKQIRFNGVVSERHKKVSKSRNMFVIVDDATYSGQQICTIIPYLMQNVKADLFVAIPFISNTAYHKICEHIDDNNFVLFPKTCYIFRSVREIVNSYISGNLISKFVNPEMYNDILDLHLLYFDFKLPDSVSIPQTIFAYGYKLRDDRNFLYLNSNDVLPFLINCENSYKQYYRRVLKNTSDVNDIVIPNCPFPFYKNIQWAFF
jgi:hypothetical protein